MPDEKKVAAEYMEFLKGPLKHALRTFFCLKKPPEELERQVEHYLAALSDREIAELSMIIGMWMLEFGTKLQECFPESFSTPSEN